MAIQAREWNIAASASLRLRLNVVLAASALLYRISWPFIDTATPWLHQSAFYTLLTKFVFVFIGLSCAVSSFPAPISKKHDSHRRVENRFMYYTTMLICVVVTTINCFAGWRWGLGAIEEYFTRGYLFEDPSRFDKVAVVVCSCVLSGTVLAVVGTQWVVVGSHWEQARRALWLKEGDVKGGRLERTSSPNTAEKAGL